MASRREDDGGRHSRATAYGPLAAAMVMVRAEIAAAACRTPSGGRMI